MNPTYDPVLDDLNAETKREYWDTAFGLQAVDNITPTHYMKHLANEHISGKKTYYELNEEVNHHYAGQPISDDKEADEVSKAIYQILADETFRFDIPTFKSYHKRLFQNLDENIFHPGEFRTINITKKEDILDGDTVQYQDYGMLEDTLKYDFDEEKSQDYTQMTTTQKITRIADFTSRIWQVHPFYEGNTRTTAIFIQKYLRNLGFSVNNDLFKDNSKFFRNALVKANYTNITKNISASPRDLESFFAELLKV